MKQRAKELLDKIKTTSCIEHALKAAHILLRYHGQELPLEEILALLPLLDKTPIDKQEALKKAMDQVLSKRMDTATFSSLLALLEDKDPLKKSLALAHIGKFKAPQAVPYLLEVITSPHEAWEMKSKALRALQGVDDARIYGQLTHLANSETQFSRLFWIGLLKKEFENNFIPSS